MDFGAAFSILFKHPKWGMNWLFAAICFLIPIVGPMVITGYMVQLFRAWHRREDPYPEFDFSFFVEYLKTGLWPFLVTLAWSVVLVPIMAIGMAVLFPAMAALGENNEGAAIAVFFVGLLMMCAVGFLFWIILIPSFIKSGAEQSFGAGFKIGFIKDFISRVPGPLFLSTFLILVMTILAVFLGYVALFIGVYFTMAWSTIFSWHVYFQLYEKYLERGGEPFVFSSELDFAPQLPVPNTQAQAPPAVPNQEEPE